MRFCRLAGWLRVRVALRASLRAANAPATKTRRGRGRDVDVDVDADAAAAAPRRTHLFWRRRCAASRRVRWRRRGVGAGDAERERQGEKRAHRVERGQRRFVYVADSYRVGNRREGVSVYQLAVKKVRGIHTHAHK